MSFITDRYCIWYARRTEGDMRFVPAGVRHVALARDGYHAFYNLGVDDDFSYDHEVLGPFLAADFALPYDGYTLDRGTVSPVRQENSAFHPRGTP